MFNRRVVNHDLRRSKDFLSTTGAEVVERLGFIETAHFHRPLDALAETCELQCAVTLPRNGNYAKIKPGRKNTVDFKLRLAGCLAERQRGEIEKRIANGALDFEGAIAAQEYHRRMSIDAPHRRPRVGCRIGQKREHFALAIVALAVVVLAIVVH